MWLINAKTYALESFEGKIPRYAILSHRWEEDEVSFKEVFKSRGRDKNGWTKIVLCCKQALRDGLAYAWVDTCCIDKRSSAELSEAINSMFKWYANSEICYVFLSDVLVNVVDHRNTEFITSAWFTRGWTLQELLAPHVVVFYDRDWLFIGTKADLARNIGYRTGVPQNALQIFYRQSYCVAEIMSWASGRQTTRLEDRAYSLLGLFDVNMPLLYGEGEKAFFRLQNEILRSSNDFSIFAWSRKPSPYDAICASSPESFVQARVSNFRQYEEWGYDVSKNTLFIPRADVRLYCLNIHILILGWVSEQSSRNKANAYIGIFIQQHPWREDEWHRVVLDGRYSINLPATKILGLIKETHDTSEIRLNIHGAENLKSNATQAWNLGYRFYDSSYSSIVALYGKLCNPFTAKVSKFTNVNVESELIIDEINPGERQCFFLWVESEDTHFKPFLVCFGRDIHDLPVVFLREISDKERRLRNIRQGGTFEIEVSTLCNEYRHLVAHSHVREASKAKSRQRAPTERVEQHKIDIYGLFTAYFRETERGWRVQVDFH